MIKQFEKAETKWKLWKTNPKAIDCFNPEGDFNYGIYKSNVPLTQRESLVTIYMFSLFWGFQVLMYILIDSDYFSLDQIIYHTIA